MVIAAGTPAHFGRVRILLRAAMRRRNQERGCPLVADTLALISGSKTYWMVPIDSISFVKVTVASSMMARALKSGCAMMPWMRRRCMPMLPPS